MSAENGTAPPAGPTGREDERPGKVAPSVPSLSHLGQAAVGYATLGWPVHPCRPGGKAPLTRWRDSATTDIDQIVRWWRQCPTANVGVTTGTPGPDVLDVDTKDGREGMELLERCRRAGLLRGAGAIVRTPSGGWHLWFDGTTQGGGAVGRDRDLELKAVGGFVLVPPSYVATETYAGRYELVERRDQSGELDWSAVRRLLAPPRPGRPAGARRAARTAAGLADWLSKQIEGNRNSALFWACCKALENGDEPELDAIAAAALGIGLPDSEVRRTIDSARRRVGGVA